MASKYSVEKSSIVPLYVPTILAAAASSAFPELLSSSFEQEKRAVKTNKQNERANNFLKFNLKSSA
ncbi:MAG: hypothetical protein EOP00_29010 [Pedobacter sp.]|nr:MAG: hypothetical protein EOP00_29010 [Pedobacter sp.]